MSWQKYYLLDDKPEFSKATAELEPNAIMGITIADVDRAEFLLNGGYLPRFIKALHYHHATELVDWALKLKMGPAYWRAPNGAPEQRLVTEQIRAGKNTNGMIFEKSCDRDRIDQCILEREREKYARRKK